MTADQNSGQRGLVMVFTGNGKGKTTAALGQALRALGHGWRVCMIRFMKGLRDGEILAAEKFLPNLTIHLCGQDSLVLKGEATPADVDMAMEALALARREAASGQWEMLILDELNVALDFGLVGFDEVLDLIDNVPPTLDIIITGRNAPQGLIDRADTVSEVREIKHHYNNGIKSRESIEF